MANPKAQQEATARYNKKAYDRIDIVVPKGKRQIIKDYAKSKGMSTNRFINEAIDKAMTPIVPSQEVWIEEEKAGE